MFSPGSNPTHVQPPGLPASPEDVPRPVRRRRAFDRRTRGGKPRARERPGGANEHALAGPAQGESGSPGAVGSTRALQIRQQPWRARRSALAARPSFAAPSGRQRRVALQLWQPAFNRAARDPRRPGDPRRCRRTRSPAPRRRPEAAPAFGEHRHQRRMLGAEGCQRTLTVPCPSHKVQVTSIMHFLAVLISGDSRLSRESQL